MEQQEFEFAKDYTPTGADLQAKMLADTKEKLKHIDQGGMMLKRGEIGVIQSNITVQFEKIHDAAKLPSKANPTDAAFDLSAAWFEKKDFSILVHTGLKMALPVGYEAQVRPRSGLALKGVTVVNSPGTIDAGYRGEVCVILGSTTGQAPFFPDANNRSVKVGNADLTVGDRVAQIVFQPVLGVTVEEVESVDMDTDRGEEGFGSSGVK